MSNPPVAPLSRQGWLVLLSRCLVGLLLLAAGMVWLAGKRPSDDQAFWKAMADSALNHQQIRRHELEELYIVLKDSGADEKTLRIVKEEIDGLTPERP